MDPKILAFIAALSLVILWFLITVGGLVYNLDNLFDARQLLRWQEASGINGLRRIVAVGHVRTEGLQLVAMASILLVALDAVFKPPWLGNWINVVLAFSTVGALSAASWLRRRDRHKLAGEKE